MRVTILLLLTIAVAVVACKKKESSVSIKPVESVDNINAYVGRNRVQLHWTLPATPVKSCKVFWNQRKDSVSVPVSGDGGELEIIIPGLAEGAYTFSIYAYGPDGNASERAEISAYAYGSKYEDSLINRPIQSVGTSFTQPDKVLITWNDRTPGGAVACEVTYRNTAGQLRSRIVPQYIHKLELDDYKRGGLLQYRTCYLPELRAIDTFYASYTPLAVSALPDFSFAGYERNEKTIPLVPVKVVLTPSAGDDGKQIQDAISAVSALPLVNGFRGAVLLKAGSYDVEEPLFIRTSGVVLRGEGQGADGTVITATGTSQYNFIQVSGSSASVESARTDLAGDVQAGSTEIPVEDASGFRVGDTILVRKTPNAHWIDTLEMAKYGWTPSGYKTGHMRIITRITGNTLSVDMPMVDLFARRFGGGYVAGLSEPGRVSHCGVENMRLASQYKSDEDEQHGWVAVSLSGTVNSWVRNVSALYFGYACVGLYHADFSTVQDCAMLDPKSITTGSRKYSFYIDKGVGNLFERCFTRGGRHDYVTGSQVTGPNVFLDCYSVQTHADIGPHHRWSTGILFDNIYGGQINVQNRGAYGSGHGWAGSEIMLWNCHGSSFIVQSPQIGENWAVGCTGGSITSKGPYDDRKGYVESWGTPVEPRSLFLSQLKERLGQAAVESITTAAQREGSIWEALKGWAGGGNPLQPFR